MLMGIKGFALEYDLRKCIFKYNSLGMDVNLFPVIYTELRPDVTLDEEIFILTSILSKLEIKIG